MERGRPCRERLFLILGEDQALASLALATAMGRWVGQREYQPNREGSGATVDSRIPSDTARRNPQTTLCHFPHIHDFHTGCGRAIQHERLYIVPQPSIEPKLLYWYQRTCTVQYHINIPIRMTFCFKESVFGECSLGLSGSGV